MKLFIKIFLLFTILMITGCGDTIVSLSGRVYDSATGQPIAGAVVSDSDYGMKNYAVTDEQGEYCYTTFCEEHTVYIEAEGYDEQTAILKTPFFPASKSMVLDIFLEN